MIDGQYFLPIWYDLLATFAFAITGAAVGLRKHYDIVGVTALAFAVGVGGGVLRDGLFLQQQPAAMTDWRYSAVIIVAVIVAICVHRYLEHHKVILIIALLDALGLAAYTIVGTQKASLAGLTLVGSILVGAINAVGGGVLRDILSHEPPQIYQPSQLYAVISVCGAVLFLFLVGPLAISAQIAAPIAIASMIIVRMASIKYDIKTTPAQDIVKPILNRRKVVDKNKS